MLLKKQDTQLISMYIDGAMANPVLARVLREHKEHTNMEPKNTICLWFDKDAEEAARFYAATFPDSKVTDVHELEDLPLDKEG